MVREIYPKGLQKIRNIQPLLSLFFSSISFQVVRNCNLKAHLSGFLFPDVEGTEVGEGDDTAVLEDFEFGGFKLVEAACGQPQVFRHFGQGNDGGFFAFDNGHRRNKVFCQ